MEVPQGMELTRTNRSGGLTTYISRHDARERDATATRAKKQRGRLSTTTTWLEVRREKVKAITPIAS